MLLSYDLPAARVWLELVLEVAVNEGIDHSRALGSLGEYANVFPPWSFTVRPCLSSRILFPWDVMSWAAMSGRIKFLSLYTLALSLMDPDWTTTAADDLVVSPFGYIATVGTWSICAVWLGTDLSGIDVSSAPQSRIGVSVGNRLRGISFVLAMRE